jgi:hypothetical protein
MLIIAISLVGVIAVVGFIAFIVLCLGIRREDKAASLDRQAPGFAAIQARRFTGLRSLPGDRILTHVQDANSAKERARADA